MRVAEQEILINSFLVKANEVLPAQQKNQLEEKCKQLEESSKKFIELSENNHKISQELDKKLLNKRLFVFHDEEFPLSKVFNRKHPSFEWMIYSAGELSKKIQQEFVPEELQQLEIIIAKMKIQIQKAKKLYVERIHLLKQLTTFLKEIKIFKQVEFFGNAYKLVISTKDDSDYEFYVLIDENLFKNIIAALK